MNNNRRHHVPVGTTKRGVNGLYDMGANVWEWLADRRGEDALTAGGSWWYGRIRPGRRPCNGKPRGSMRSISASGARMIARRRLFAIALLAVGLLVSASFAMVRPIWASEAAAWQALDQGAIVLFRHANAPGTGDPAWFRLEDCSTQRNLDEAGREQARRWGQRFRERALTPGRVISSRWCRARETADLAFPGQRRDEPAFDSFFEAPQQRMRQPRPRGRFSRVGRAPARWWW